MWQEALATWLAGQGIDTAAEKSGLKDRAKGIMGDLYDAIIPQAAAADASAIPQQDLIPADVVMTPAQEQQVIQNAAAYNGLPYRESGEPVGANAMLPEGARQPQVTQMQPAQLPDMQMQKTPEDIARETQEFVRSVGGRTQALMQEVPEEKRSDPEVQKSAAATATTEGLAGKGIQGDDDGFFDSIGGFLTDLFGDEERMTRLALAFNSMRYEPDQGLASVLGKRLDKLEERRSGNKTLQLLKSKGTPKALALATAMESGLKVTAKDLAEALGTGVDAESEQKLRKELSSTEAAKNVAQVSIAFDRIKAVADSPSAAGDLALIFNYMKMLDPASVVRESEFATAQNATGVPDRIRNIYNNLLKGERLAPAQREDFINQAGTLYNSAVSEYQPEYERYTGLAKSYGYEPSRIARQYKQYEKPSKPEQAQAGTPVGTVKTFTTADGAVAKYRKIANGSDTDSTTWQKVD